MGMLSIVIAFENDEDCVGTAIRRLHKHFTSLGHEHELFAVNQHSEDNSHALVTLVARSTPLELIGQENGIYRAILACRGQYVWLTSPKAVLSTVAVVQTALRSLEGGADLVVRHQEIFIRRDALLKIAKNSPEKNSPLRLIRRAKRNKLVVADLFLPLVPTSPSTQRLSRLSRFFS